MKLARVRIFSRRTPGPLYRPKILTSLHVLNSSNFLKTPFDTKNPEKKSRMYVSSRKWFRHAWTQTNLSHRNFRNFRERKEIVKVEFNFISEKYDNVLLESKRLQKLLQIFSNHNRIDTETQTPRTFTPS